MSASVHIRPQTPDDDARAVEIDNVVTPGLPPATVEEYRHRLSALPAHAGRTAVVAERDGRVVGRAAWQRFLFVADPGAYLLSVAVDPGEQQQGIGSALFIEALSDIRRRDVSSIHSSVRENDQRSRDFAEHRGFRPTGDTERFSQLDVATARLDRCREADERVRVSGIRITTLAELGTDEATLRNLWAMENRTSRDIPGSMDWEGLPYDFWREMVLHRPGARLDAVWIALDGDTPVGLANLHVRAASSAENGYTCVEAAYRGRGIARALKLRTVEWASQHGIRTIVTGNNAENRSMLAINMDMGYEPLPASVEMVLRLDKS